MAQLAHTLVALLLLAPAGEPAGPPAPAAAATATATAGVVAGTVTLTRERGALKADRSGVVVYLELPTDDDELAEGLDDGAEATPPPVHTIRQVNKTFLPAVSAVLRGTEVQFPNDDMIFHNVFSLSKSKRFDLGLYKSGTSKSVTLPRAGVIDVYCNIHPEMAAKILVLDNPYFAVSGPDGAFRIEGVPPGTYPYVAWQPRGEPVRGEVTVVAGGEARLDPQLVETPQSNLHTRKDGSPYGRYN